MRLTPHTRRTAHRLNLPDGTRSEELTALLQRYDPKAVRRRRRIVVADHVVLKVKNGQVRVPPGQEVLARGLHRHLGGQWQVAPPEAGEQDEPLHDLVRVYVARKLLAAELATVLRPALPGVVIREDQRLGLFWFDDEDSELTVSAWATQGLPPAAAALRDADAVYEVGIDDVHGPTAESAAEAWRIARLLEQELGGVPIDRYGFRVTGAHDLLA